MAGSAAAAVAAMIQPRSACASPAVQRCGALLCCGHPHGPIAAAPLFSCHAVR